MTNHGVDQIIKETQPSSEERNAALRFRYTSDLFVGSEMMGRAIGALARQRDLEYEPHSFSMGILMLWTTAWVEMVKAIGYEASVRVHRAIAKDMKSTKMPKAPTKEMSR